jgi:hypothetical protein
MSRPPLRLQHVLIIMLIGVLFFAWGAWLMRERAPAAALPWLADFDTEVLTPLADDRLAVSQLPAAEAAELWLQPRLDGARLFYRTVLPVEGASWQLDAELDLSASERASLLAALDAAPGSTEQQLGRPLLEQMSRYRILNVQLLAPADQPTEPIASTLGAPRLRLELAEGQAWVYPERGLTVHTVDDQVRMLHAVPRKALKQP